MKMDIKADRMRVALRVQVPWPCSGDALENWR